ncbi:MAG TPA: cyclopropane-fatty-acyl-phospholipid synthase family protein [Leptospiraceae bacterium]|nr:cyclopropane-fatty-acyl-phospholipid synthase family protein [Leptospiraceae bacterium]HMW03931.1 cyclopropane-fatty-acyl-phospholipid synthase family protein [Leptospiraceae bacterium]HMX33150.1 cyclopropane-fatty-acyl-phospholipid synthase family protein [Leptospiraceae bacterium]HMY29911.1 cyclopropane-fatty-acyl-phospholipid synthase family protein [Leptospiraceae bacterium]HNA08273.1 cyclopropane-fatty-acyl-phospholipid synthase family protein [Leptospiraceae bacterium]
MERTVENEVVGKQSLSLSLQTKIYKKLFQNALSKMKLGSMKIVDPDGTAVLYGDTTKQYESFNSAHILVKSYDFYRKSVYYGDIGFAESYLDGDWETENISEVISWFILNVEDSPNLSGTKKSSRRLRLFNFFNRLYHNSRANTVTGSKKNIVDHYDLGNHFYKLFLDETMTYSSAYFKTNKETLEEAQILKYDALCQKIKLNSSHHLLEIGSGWGGFSTYAASKYGCKVTTVTISDEQFKYAKDLIHKKGLENQIDIQLCDYRYIQGKYDRIVSIEMLEAVGHNYFETYFAKCNEVLKKNGVIGLQYITCPDSRYEQFRTGIDFIQKYIFPGSLLPSIGRINEAINRTSNLFLFHLEDMGLYYAKTLKLWLDGFDKNIGKVRELGFDEKFIRTWRYYLSYCNAAFKMRNISVVQAVYTRPNNMEI